MNVFDVSDIQAVVQRMVEFEARCELLRDHMCIADASDADIKEARSIIAETERLTVEQPFDRSHELAEHLCHAIQWLKKDYSTLQSEIRHLREEMYSDLMSATFLVVKPNREKYIDNTQCLGKEIATEFPLAQRDVYWAGNCLAAECPDAAVFHLMRIVEWGLRKFCSQMGFTKVKARTKSGKKKYIPVSYSDWEHILNQLQSVVDRKLEKMKRGQQKQRAQEFYYPLLQDIRAIRDASRNHVMHARTEYSDEEAWMIMIHVKRIMTALANGKCRKERVREVLANSAHGA